MPTVIKITSLRRRLSSRKLQLSLKSSMELRTVARVKICSRLDSQELLSMTVIRLLVVTILGKDQSITERLWIKRNMARVNKFGQMVLNTKVCGRTTEQTVKGHLYMQMETFIRACGWTTKLTVRGRTSTQTEQLMSENGSKINSTEWVLKAGLMAQSIRVSIKTVKRTVRVT